MQLEIEAADATSAIAARVRQLDTSHLATIARIVGLDDPGAPIRVVLAGEDSELARRTPAWIAGFAAGGTSTVVLFPARAPRYPDESLEALLNHEIAHVLIHRAAGGGPVPRWFNEGLATAAEHEWSFEDARHLAWAVASGRELRVETLDDEFRRGEGPAARAYAVSSAFVRSIIEQHGRDAPADILTAVAQGLPFDEAYASATGETLEDAQARFRREIVSWDRIIPLLTSPFVLWTAISLLALYAIYVSRRRRRERRALWPDDDQEPESEDGSSDEHAEDGRPPANDSGRGT